MLVLLPEVKKPLPKKAIIFNIPHRKTEQDIFDFLGGFNISKSTSFIRVRVRIPDDIPDWKRREKINRLYEILK
jgi:hypothetical protein